MNPRRADTLRDRRRRVAQAGALTLLALATAQRPAGASTAGAATDSSPGSGPAGGDAAPAALANLPGPARLQQPHSHLGLQTLGLDAGVHQRHAPLLPRQAGDVHGRVPNPPAPLPALARLGPCYECSNHVRNALR